MVLAFRYFNKSLEVSYNLNKDKRLNPIKKTLSLLHGYDCNPLVGNSSNDNYISFKLNASLSRVKFQGDLILVHKSMNMKKMFE
jgi:hypothetical protein